MNTKLTTLKTELREFIELSKTITPGRWQHNEGRRMCLSVVHNDKPVLWGYEYEIHNDDATFIARSRNISPAMAECLLVAVDALDHEDASNRAVMSLQQILNIWEAAK